MSSPKTLLRDLAREPLYRQLDYFLNWKKDASLREVIILMGKEDSMIPQQAVYNKKSLICSQN